MGLSTFSSRAVPAPVAASMRSCSGGVNKARVTLLGPFAQLTETPLTYRRLPPRIGEHHGEIYGDELGLSVEELMRLREANVI
jgi:crotonobetainyl-CoA:carnitine CoA-transferase CaiB-like acyl-CoA transferase